MVVCYPWVRKLAFLKMFFVSLTISWLTTVFAFGDAFSVFCEVLFWHRVLLVFSLLVPFEISDVLEDALPYKTLPQSMGVPTFKFIGLIFLVLYGILSMFLPFLGVHILMGVLSALAIFFPIVGGRNFLLIFGWKVFPLLVFWDCFV
jgi:hypothetical protein